MKKTYYSNRRLSSIVAIIAVVLLQSCCFLFNPSVSKQKKCNCKDDIPGSAASQKVTAPTDESMASISSNIMDVKDVSLSIDADFVDQPVQLTEVKPSEIITRDEPVTANAKIAETMAKKTERVNYMLEQLVLPGQKKITGESEKKLPLGIKGINTSLIAAPNVSFKSSKEDYGNTDHKHKPGVGFQFGIGTTYMFSEKFSVSTSLLFKQNNASEVLSYSTPGEPGSGSQEFKTRYSYSYLSAPVLAEMKLTDQLTASAGPELNYLLGASAKSEGTYGDDGKVSLTESSVKLGLGMQLGLRYELPNSPIAIQLLYDHRLSRLNEKNESDYYPGGGSYDSPAWNMKSIQLGITCSLCELMKK